MRYLASVSYDGSKFYGFQKLNKHKTIQGEIEKALTKINKTVVMCKGAGRTDRGVHAFNQKVSFDLDINITEEGLKRALNSLLSPYIYVNNIEVVNNNFHARFDVKKKFYEYVINLGEYDAIDNDYLYNYCRKLDIKKMKKAAKSLVGFHSFKAFTSGERENYNSVIYKIKFKKKKDILVISFVGKSFYRYMVRNLVGTLIAAGEGKISNDDITNMINKEKNTVHYITVPAGGLYLVDVYY